MRKMSKTKKIYMLLFLIAVFLFTTGTVSARDDRLAMNVFELGEIVVTGKQEAVTQITTIEVMDREQLERKRLTNPSFQGFLHCIICDVMGKPLHMFFDNLF